jgi:hypothetical protein
MSGAVPLRHLGTFMVWTEANLFFLLLKMSNNLAAVSCPAL